jgi:hypothetical protein
MYDFFRLTEMTVSVFLRTASVRDFRHPLRKIVDPAAGSAGEITFAEMFALKPVTDGVFRLSGFHDCSRIDVCRAGIQHLADLLMNDEIGDLVIRRAAHIDQRQLAALVIVDKAGRRIDVE